MVEAWLDVYVVVASLGGLALVVWWLRSLRRERRDAIEASSALVAKAWRDARKGRR